jgi:hypothetical protein
MELFHPEATYRSDTMNTEMAGAGDIRDMMTRFFTGRDVTWEVTR